MVYHNAGAGCVLQLDLKGRESISRFVREVPCMVNIMARPSAPEISKLEQIVVRRLKFGSDPMRAILPFIQRLAKGLRASGQSDLLVQTEVSHATANELFKS